MTHPIVEAGARALFALEFDDKSDAWDESPYEQEDYRSMSKAGILAALRESKSPSMALGTEFRSYGVSLDKWRWCIDALIKEIEG